MTKQNLLDLDAHALTAYFTEMGEKPFRAKQLLRWMHQVGESDFAAMTDIAAKLREKLAQCACVTAPDVMREELSDDGTRKWLLNMGTGNAVEAVYIPEATRGTLCISSQAGCALDCSFCSTGKQGFNRNLSVAEIIGQLWWANHQLGKNAEGNWAISNVVMMGMGEPLANLDNLLTALDILLDPRGLNFSDRKVTVSTCGLIPKMAELGRRSTVNLAISLHASDDHTRNQLMPVNATYPLVALLEVLRLGELLPHGIGFHTDACLGGFVLPWAERLGYPVPKFDFRLAGVTSMSADTHKYGYAAKGTSVVLYRGFELLHHQYYTASDWPGGLYFSPTFAGSRPGALSAACWAALTSIGEQGYLDATKRILETAAKVKEGIRQISELRVLGDPLFVVAFASDSIDVYKVLDFMSHKKWSLNGLHKPTCVHLCVTLRHTQPGVAERFLADLREAVEHVKAHPEEKGTMAPVYGMASTIPLRGLVSDMLKKYLDLIFKP